MTATINIALDQDWATKGKCRNVDPEDFFLGEFDDAYPAREVCSTCPVMRDCLRYAIDNEKYGLWGGATEKQRDAMRAGITAGINQCPHCDSEWVGRAALREHLTIAHVEEIHPFLCECGRRFATDHGMRSHVGRTHGQDVP